MKQKFTKEIGEFTYESEQLHLVEAKKISLFLGKKGVPALLVMLKSAPTLQGLFESQDNIAGAIGMGLMDIIKDLEMHELDMLEQTFGRSCRILHEDGRNILMTKEVINNHFHGGNLMNYFKWLWFCIEGNFTDFFSAAESAIQKKKMKE